MADVFLLFLIMNMEGDSESILDLVWYWDVRNETDESTIEGHVSKYTIKLTFAEAM